MITTLFVYITLSDLYVDSYPDVDLITTAHPLECNFACVALDRDPSPSYNIAGRGFNTNVANVIYWNVWVDCLADMHSRQ